MTLKRKENGSSPNTNISITFSLPFLLPPSPVYIGLNFNSNIYTTTCIWELEYKTWNMLILRFSSYHYIPLLHKNWLKLNLIVV